MPDEITTLRYVVTKLQSELSAEELKERLARHREKADETIRLLSMNHALLVRSAEGDKPTSSDEPRDVS